MSKAENVAKFAYQVGMNALSTSQVHGLLFTGLLTALRESNVLTGAQTELIFRGAAASVDAGAPADDRSREVQRNMRSAIQHIAEGFGVEIPEPGMSATPKKH